ncbi:MAG: S9 family peptidase [Candidatus Hodarchaeota archaeon]
MTIRSEDLVQLKFPNSPSLSPDGKNLVFSIKNVNQKENQYKAALYLKTEEINEVVQYTSGTHVDTAPQFSPNGEHLAFLSSRSEKKVQVFIMPTAGGEAFQITNFSQGVLGFTWSHNSESILVLTRVNEKELEGIIQSKSKKTPSFVLEPIEYQIYKSKKEQKKTLKTDPRVITEGYCREGTSYLDGRFAQPFIISIPKFDLSYDPEGMKNIVHLGEFGFHFTIGAFSLDDSEVFLSKFKSDPTISLKQDILKITISAPSIRTVLGEAFGWVNNFQVSPDGKYLSFESIREETVYDDTQIFLFDLEKGYYGEFNCITEEYNRSAVQSRWTSNNTLLFSSPSNGRINIHKINVDDRKVELIVSGDRNINSFAVSKNAARITYEVSHSSFPSDIFWCKGDGSGEERVTETNNVFLEKNKPAQVKAFTYEREGVDFQGWIFFPANHNPNEKLPVVLEIHGGPAAMWCPHEKTLFHEWNTLVSKGYAVVFCNPRGSDGYGINFRSAVFKNWGIIAANDILKGLDKALEKFSFLDGNRIAVTGGSYGGYMTAWLVTHSERFKAAVAQRGVYEFISFGMTTDIPNWFERQYGGEIIDLYAENWKDSPVAHIKNLNTPLLIIHSDNDFRVPIVSAEQLFWLGKRYGKKVEFVRYPRDGHELSRSGEPRHIIDRINRIVEWIQKYNK